MENIEKLEPCPWCGSKAVHITDACPHYIYCLGCGIKVQLKNRIYEGDIPRLVQTWNKRITQENGATAPAEVKEQNVMQLRRGERLLEYFERLGHLKSMH